MWFPRKGFAALSSFVAIAAFALCAACGGQDGSPSTRTGSGAPPADASAGEPPKNDDAAAPTPPVDDDAAAQDSGPEDSDAAKPAGLDPKAPPGSNFDLSIWELQEPVGSPGAPTTILAKDLEAGFQDKYFYTDPTDGAMTFWDPSNGVTTPNSNYSRSELREMTKSGAAANWAVTGNHTMSATLMATEIPDHAAVGQIHLGTGTPSSTKPLLELYYYKSGKIELAIEKSPAGDQTPHSVGNVPLGKTWSYVIGLSGNTISLTIDGGAPQKFDMSPTFNQEGMYFKAGNYDQSTADGPNVSATVKFYALVVAHSN